MKLEKAVAELRSTVKRWKRFEGEHVTVDTGCALSVAETLLAAFDRIDLDVLDGLRSQSICISPPPADPTTLAGRTVDGWGWKVFRKVDGGLMSESEGRGRRETQLKEGVWLHYLDWVSEQYCRYRRTEERPVPGFHIFESEAVAQRWKLLNFYSSKELVVRKVAWRNRRKDNLDYAVDKFRNQMFTAEEIYILPEEGMPAERPPEKGDWVLIGDYTEPQEILRVEPKRGWDDDQLWIKDGWHYPKRVRRIVRRAADPLREKDRVKFGSEEGWIYATDHIPRPISVNFGMKREGSPQDREAIGHFHRGQLTLVSPVFDRPAEKKDC